MRAPVDNRPVPAFLTSGPRRDHETTDKPSAIVRQLNRLKESVVAHQRPPQPAPDPTDTLVQEGMASFYRVRDERDHFRAEAADLKTQLAAAIASFEQLKSNMARLQAERDTYMRFSTDITTRLNVVRQTVDDAVQEATRYAYKPPTVAPLPDDTQRMEQLEREISAVVERPQ